MEPIPSPLDLTIALVQVPSITPEDHGCQDVLIGPLQQMGFTVYPLPFGNVRNFYARLGTHGKNFCFAGHTDVVSTGDRALWRSDPFAAEVRDGILTGRGVCDMKGGLACMLTATARFLRDNPDFSQKNSLSFLITGDEEGDAIHGTVCVLEWLAQRGEGLDYCLVGEPTNMARLGDGLKLGRRGSLNGELLIHGRQGHVAYPTLADNPIHRVAPILDQLAHLSFDTGNRHFPATTLQFTQIHAGDSSTNNVIPGLLRVGFNFRFSPESSPESLEGQLREVLDRMVPPSSYTLKTVLSGLPFLTAEGPFLTQLSESIQQVTGIRPTPSTGGGTSDARFISKVCPQTLEFGLLSASIHKINEQVQVADLEQLTRVYEHLLHTLFSAPTEIV